VSDLGCDAWLASLARQGMAHGTRLKYGAHVRHFLAWLGDRDPSTVVRRDVEEYLDAWHAADGPCSSSRESRRGWCFGTGGRSASAAQPPSW
jgi:hypothetical protein